MKANQDSKIENDARASCLAIAVARSQLVVVSLRSRSHTPPQLALRFLLAMSIASTSYLTESLQNLMYSE